MEKNKIKHLIERIRSGSSSKRRSALLEVRTSVISSAEGVRLFRELGGLKALDEVVARRVGGSGGAGCSEEALDVALSALGNCCLEEESCREVGLLETPLSLLPILKYSPRDSVVGRACRVLSNLCRERSTAERLHAAGAVRALLSTLSSAHSPAPSPHTQAMAVRALRLLWVVRIRREEMLACEVVRVVATILSVAAASPPSSGRHQLCQALLKCFTYFASHSSKETALQSAGDGSSLKSLVQLCGEAALRPAAVGCLATLCGLREARPLLGNAGAVTCLVGLMEDNPVESCPLTWVRALCLLSREAVNRARVRESGGLLLLLRLAREAGARTHTHTKQDTDMLSKHTLTLQALLQYVFDEPGFQILIVGGLIPVIEDQLHHYVTSMKCEHRPDNTTPAKKDSSKSKGSSHSRTNGCEEMSLSSTEESCSRVTIERDSMVVGFHDSYESDSSGGEVSDSEWLHSGRVCAPSATKKRTKAANHATRPKNQLLQKMAKYDWGMSGISWESSGERSPSLQEAGSSPQASPSSGCSPAWSLNTEEDSSDSEKSCRYSPVCSDNEEVGVPLGNDTLEDEEVASLPEAPAESVCVGESVAYLLVLLSRAAYCPAGMDRLATPRLLQALLALLGRSRNPLSRASRILARIVSYETHLITLLQQRLVVPLQQLQTEPKHDSCRQCSQLSELSSKLLLQLKALAESEYGSGELSYHLQKGAPDTKLALALMVPRLITAEKQLKKLMVTHGGLDVVLSVVGEAVGSCSVEQGVAALAALATAAHLKDPQQLEERFSGVCPAPPHYLPPGPSCPHQVTLLLDDGSSLQADKHFLCQSSEVFNVMLTGAFKESQEKEVQLGKVSRPALEYLLALVQAGGEQHLKNKDKFPVPKELPTALETLLLSDRFMMESLKSQLFGAIVHFLLSASTASAVYRWSLERGAGLLCVEAVAFALAGRMLPQERLHLFQDVLHTQYRQQWLDDITDVLLRHLGADARVSL